MYALIETGNVLTISTKSVPLGGREEKSSVAMSILDRQTDQKQNTFFCLNTFAAN
jgi:hypothetical protein